VFTELPSADPFFCLRFVMAQKVSLGVWEGQSAQLTGGSFCCGFFEGWLVNAGLETNIRAWLRAIWHSCPSSRWACDTSSPAAHPEFVYLIGTRAAAARLHVGEREEVARRTRGDS